MSQVQESLIDQTKSAAEGQRNLNRSLLSGWFYDLPCRSGNRIIAPIPVVLPGELVPWDQSWLKC